MKWLYRNINLNLEIFGEFGSPIVYGYLQQQGVSNQIWVLSVWVEGPDRAT